MEPSDFLRVLGKEMLFRHCGRRASLVNGLRIYLMYTFLYAGQYENVLSYAVVVSVSLFFSVIRQSWWAVCCRWPQAGC